MKQAKQKQIFDSWLSQHRGLLFKIVRAYAATLHDQEDLFQEVTLQIWNSIPAFREESAVTTWLYRIALYAAMSWSRKETRHHDSRQSFEGVVHTLTELSQPKDDRLEWLYEQIYQLDEVDRSLTLLLLDGFSYREMATLLGISESNVGVKINRIKKQLVLRSERSQCHGP